MLQNSRTDPSRGRRSGRSPPVSCGGHTGHDAVCPPLFRPSVRLEVRRMQGSFWLQTRRRRSSAVGRPGEHSHRGAARTCRVHEPTSHDDSRLGRAQPSTLLHPFRMEWITCSTSRKTPGAEDWQKGASTVRRDLSHLMAVSSRSMHMATTFRTVWPESTIHSRGDDRPAIPCMDRVRTCDGAWPGAVCRRPSRACTADPRPERLQWVSP